MAKAALFLRNLLPSSNGRKRPSKRDKKGSAAMNGGGGGSAADDPNDLLPRYLAPLVRHYHDDFYVSRSFDPRLIVQLMAEGFLPIATRGYLLPKLHVERCVLRLNPASELHISRSTRKKCKRFLLSVNESFDRVVAGCHRQHGTNWLYPQIVAAFKAIHDRTKGADGGGVDATIIDEETHHPLTGHHPLDSTPVRLYSIEIWNAETGALAGGELGYSVGGIYSSLTGFSDEDAAGSCQLVALGKLLARCGFEYWDLGMDLEYKRRLGATIVQRSDFVSIVKRSRVEDKGVVLQCGGDRRNAKELVDWEPANGNATKGDDGGGKRPHPSSEVNSAQNGDEGRASVEERDNQKSNRKRLHEQESDLNGGGHEHKVGKGA